LIPRVDSGQADPNGGQLFHEKHGTTAAWAAPQSRDSRFRQRSVRNGRWSHRQQLPAEWQQRSTATVGEKAEEADADEASGKHMEKKSPQEFLRGYGHQLLFVAMRIIFPPKCDFAICESHDPVVGDSHAMCVARQIVQDMIRPSERRFRINHPVVSIERTKKRTEGGCLGQSIQSAGKAQLSFRNARFRPATNLPRKTRLSTLTSRKNAYLGRTQLS
jgi:hypothetical protein